MRRIRPATIVSSFCRPTIAAPFSTANPKPKPHTDIFGGFVRNQLQSEERARKALGIWFRNYGGRATQDDDELMHSSSDLVSLSQEEFDAFHKNIWIECQTDYKKYEIVRKIFHEVYKMMFQDDDTDDESGDATQNDRVDKLAEIAAEEELDALITNSFVTNLMIECEPKYEKRFREIIEKVRKKMIQDDGILESFELVTNLLSSCELEYEKLLCEVLEKICYKISQDDKGENDNTSKIEKLAKLGMDEGKLCSLEEKLDEVVTEAFLKNFRYVEGMKTYFMAFEVIEKVAKKVGNENLRKIAEEQLDALVIATFVSGTMLVQTSMPCFKLLRIKKSRRRFFNKFRSTQEEFSAFLKNLWIECQTDNGTDYEKCEIVRGEFHKVLSTDDDTDDDTDDESGDATQNDRVDKLAEKAAEEELDALITNSFVTNLMIECEPKYEKRFREIIEKVRKKMIQDDRILDTFELVTDFMSKCESEYEKILCEVLEKVREKITQDDNDNTSKIEKLAKLDMKVGKFCSFEEKLDEFVTDALLTNLRSVEKKKSYFMAYEVIEKVAKKVGNENIRKIAEEKLDALVTYKFAFETAEVQTNMPQFKRLRIAKGLRRRARRAWRQLEGRKSEFTFLEIIQ